MMNVPLGVKIFFLLILTHFITSCNKKKSVVQSFYHWELDVKNNQNSIPETLSNIQNKRIFLHILDINYSNESKDIIPISKLNIADSHYLLSKEIVPVIFIVNDALLHLDTMQVKDLAQKILKIHASFSKKVNKNLNELQIDCDWTSKTRDTYFQLLREIKNNNPSLILSSTIRLYPYKYNKKMGVPPVDYGVLMCYNMDNIKNHQTPNSIFNTQVLAQYLPKKNRYPIPLIPALPIYGWSVWFQNGNYQTILYTDPRKWNSHYIKNIDAHHFQIQKDTIISEKLLRPGDELRMEYPEPEKIIKTRNMLTELFNSDEVIYFHWS